MANLEGDNIRRYLYLSNILTPKLLVVISCKTPQQQPNPRLKQPEKFMTGVSTITVQQEKLICNKASTTTIVEFQLEIIPILKRDIQNFRGGNLKTI